VGYGIKASTRSCHSSLWISVGYYSPLSQVDRKNKK
jgi:hypothetical protein